MASAAASPPMKYGTIMRTEHISVDDSALPDERTPLRPAADARRFSSAADRHPHVLYDGTAHSPPLNGNGSVNHSSSGSSTPSSVPSTPRADPAKYPSVLRRAPTSIRLVLLICLTMVAGIGNNVSFVKMGLAMPAYPLFLLYGTTAMYLIIFFVWLALRMREQRRQLAEQQKASSGGVAVHFYPMYSPNVSVSALAFHYVTIGALIVVGGALSQFANVYVSGSIQSLMNQITLPLTALFVHCILKHRYQPTQILGVCIVLFGSLIGIVFPLFIDPPTYALVSDSAAASANSDSSSADASDSSEMNSLFWLVCFFLSDVPSAITNVYEEYLFDVYACDEIHYLAWTNCVTLPLYLACIPLALIPRLGVPMNIHGSADLLQNQIDALRCFFALEPLPAGCLPHAWMPCTAFVFCVVLYFYLLAVIVKHESALFQVLINSLVTPLSTIAFSLHWLMGDRTELLTPYAMLSCVLIPVGIIVYKYDDIIRKSKGEVMLPEDEEILPLIARH